MAGRQYRSFRDFYPFYLTEHSRSGTRRLHFAGTLLVLLTLAYSLATRRWGLLALHRVYSLAGDFRMFADMARGRVPF